MPAKKSAFVHYDVGKSNTAVWKLLVPVLKHRDGGEFILSVSGHQHLAVGSFSC